MVNLKNLDDAINIMRRVKERGSKVRMTHYQHCESTFGATEAEVHACGNSACFAGWVAVSPEWREFGGSINTMLGHPVLPDRRSMTVRQIIGHWLGISEKMAEFLVFGSCEGDGPNAYSTFYRKRWGDVGADDVIAALTDIREKAVSSTC